MIDSRYYRSLAQLFTQPVFDTICQFKQPDIMNYVVRHSGYIDSLRRNLTFGEFFDDLYDLLMKHYRCEYVYKNSIANKILADRHSPEFSTILSEFRVDDCKADVVVLNGTSSV